METFSLRKRIHDRSKPPLVIFPITLAHPALVEIAGYAGAEAVLLDCEHGMMSPETIRDMLSCASSSGTAAVFRPRSFDPVACRQALDSGAAGVHVSHVDTADEARAAVDACRYAPVGCREMSLGRAVHFKAENLKPYVAQANDDQLLTVMIESLAGVDNVEEIAAVPAWMSSILARPTCRMPWDTSSNTTRHSSRTRLTAFSPLPRQTILLWDFQLILPSWSLN